IRRAGFLPRILGPLLVRVLAWARNSVKGPAQNARMDIERADITRRRRFQFAGAETNDDEILVDHPRRSQGDVVLGRLATQVLAQVDTAILAESRNRLSTTWIECVEAIHHAGKKPSLRSVGPIRESALRTGPTNPGIELPQHLPGR